MYDVNFFIRKFEAIPESLWTIYNFINDKDQCCANGHCGVRGITNSIPKEAVGLQNVFSVLSYKENHDKRKYPNYSVIAANINNGDDSRYPQPTPKQRILAALYDIKRMQEPEVKTVTKYVVVSETIRKAAKEVVLS